MHGRSLRTLGALLLLASVYFAAGKFGLGLAFVNPSASAVWPPTGIALAACLILGYHVWPGLLLGAFLVNLTTTGALLPSLSIAVGNTLEGLLGAYLVKRFANGPQAFDRAGDTLRFVVLAGLVSTTVSATVGVTSLALAGLAAPAAYGPIWLTWWLGDAGGALIVAPALILWARYRRVHWDPQRAWEAAFLLLALILVGLIVFDGLTTLGAKNLPLEFLLVPLMVWIAFRFGQREAATATLILSAIAIWGTLRGFGPFGRVAQNEALMLLQAYMGALASVGLGLAAAVTERRQVEAVLRAAHARLKRGFGQLEQRQRETAWLNESSDLLQSCLTVEEAYVVIKQMGEQFFGSEAGSLYLIGPTRDLMEVAAAWGDPQSDRRVFAPDDCWALRRGRTHWVTAARTGLLCHHVLLPAPAAYICIPLIAHGETLGIFHLRSQRAKTDDLAAEVTPALFTASRRQLAQTVADSVALALANLRLRETLRQQSIRDALTGLFNRRYLEESLDRELRRATRNESTVGVILFDVDLFKNFNDTWGHAAGDTFLRELGHFLKRQIRGGDIACRYGGDEFLLLLPDADLATTRHRADELRAGVRALALPGWGGDMLPVTLSIGLAVYPLHGRTREAVLQVADAALYQAKHAAHARAVTAEAS